VQPEDERGDHAEVAAAAPDRPEQVGVLLAAGAHALAAREHELGLEQVVDRQAELGRQVTEAAAERQAADAGGRDDAARSRQAVLVRRAVDLAPGAAAADPDRPGLRIDVDRLEPGQVDDDAAVARAQPGAVVTATANGQQQAVLVGERDDRRDVVGARAASDDRWAPVDHAVVDPASGVVVRVFRPDQRSLEPRQLAARGLTGRYEGAHVCRPPRSLVSSGRRYVARAAPS